MSLYRSVGLAVRKPHDVVTVFGDHRHDTRRSEDGMRTHWVRRVGRPILIEAQGEHLIEVAFGVMTKVHGLIATQNRVDSNDSINSGPSFFTDPTAELTL